MAKMSGARYIAEFFKAYGVTHYFYMPVSIHRAIKAIEIGWEQPDLHVHGTQSRSTRSGTDIGIKANAIERNVAIGEEVVRPGAAE